MTANTDAPPASASARILIAEDSPLNLQVALKQMERLGYAADGVRDGTAVLEALKRTAYDIILMDCQMPGLSGYEAAWQIREDERRRVGATPEAKRVYIIAMTANVRDDSRGKCLQAGMDDYISKPVELRELEAAVHRGLADRASQKELEAVIDPMVIAGLRQLRIPGKPDPLPELIDLFLEEAPAQINLLEAAALENNESSLARVYRAAAALKGNAGNLGVRNLAALCDEIEQTARNWSLSEVVPLVERARQEFARARESLLKMKDSVAVARFA